MKQSSATRSTISTTVFSANKVFATLRTFLFTVHQLTTIINEPSSLYISGWYSFYSLTMSHDINNTVNKCRFIKFLWCTKKHSLSTICYSNNDLRFNGCAKSLQMEKNCKTNLKWQATVKRAISFLGVLLASATMHTNPRFTLQHIPYISALNQILTSHRRCIIICCTSALGLLCRSAVPCQLQPETLYAKKKW